MVGFAGTSAPASVLESVRTGRIGGFQYNPDPNLYPPGPAGNPTLYQNLYPYYYVFDPRNSGL